MVDPGDWTGPGGAWQILGRSDLDVAVLETARGGLVLRGMGYESNDVSVVTNVTSDHLDLQGIHTLPELAEVKSTVARVTKPDGWCVLNADDPHVARLASRVRGQVAFFTLVAGGSAAVRRHAEAGGRGYAVDGEWLVELDGSPLARGSSRFGGSRSRSAGSPGTTSRTPWPRRPRPAGSAYRSRRSPTGSPTSGPVGAGAGPAQPVPGRVADRDRRLRPQRGRGRGGARRRRRASPAVPPVARRRSRRSSGPPATGPTTRSAASPGSRRSGPSASRSRRRSSTSAAGPARRSSGRCWPGSRPPVGPSADVPVYESETAALRGELANGDGRPAVIVLMCHEEREEVFALLEKLGAKPIDVASELTTLAPRLQERPRRG